jgi:hypothetical protein
LEDAGFQRLCPDEEVFRRHGHYGRDFPRGEFLVREAPVLKDIALELQQLLAAGRDTVVDHGFWTREERAQWAATALEAGGEPVLIYLPVPHEVRWARIQKRNEQSLVDANSVDSPRRPMTSRTSCTTATRSMCWRRSIARALPGMADRIDSYLPPATPGA